MYHYILWVFAITHQTSQELLTDIQQLKAFSLVFEFIAGWYLIKLLKEKLSSNQQVFNYSLFFFLNPIIFYNSMLWGQVDGIMTCLVFISVYYALKEKIFLSILFFILSLNFKLQVIIFLPVIGLILLPLFVKYFNLKKILVSSVLLVLVQTAILLPFILTGEVNSILNVVTESVGYFPVISMNAYNVWYIFIAGDPMKYFDTAMFFGISCKNWGFIMFFTASFFCLLPLLSICYTSIFTKKKTIHFREIVLLICAGIPLIFFFFNTQMHERYSHPSLIFLLTYGLLYNRKSACILFFIGYFLNNEAVFHHFQLLKNTWFIFNEEFIAIIFAASLSKIYYDLYTYYKLQRNLT